MNKKDDDIAHPGMLSKPEKHLILAQFTNSPWTGSDIRAAGAENRTRAGQRSAGFHFLASRWKTKAVLGFVVAKGRIAEIYVISSPDRIQQLMNYRRSH